MRNISFDNPYWLLLAIPLLALLLVPYFISANRENRSRGWKASLVLHIIIALSVTLAAAGLTYTAVMTRTKVYIVADVSHSTKENLDLIDDYIQQISDAMPTNSRLGIVCFGRDTVILTSSGEEIKSVHEAVVDTSGTDIAGALDETSTYFSEGELKRIILITDGCDTASEGSVTSAVERLKAKKIKLDAVYVDSNLGDGAKEVQISDALYTGATYLGHESELKLLVEAGADSDVILDLFAKSADETEYVKIDTTAVKAVAGINLFSFTLPTDVAGVFDYRVELSASDDTSDYNNTYSITQSVTGKRRVLLVTEDEMDAVTVMSLYSSVADVEPHVVGQKKIPYTVEELSRYDEIILSNVDIRNIDNIGAFIDSVDIVVSQFGKSLITLGDLKMQNKDDENFKKLEELLPVSYGNANKDEKLYTIILDVSRSMFENYKLTVAKDAATKLVSMLNDDDSLIYLPFAGKVLLEEGWKPMKLGDIVTFEGASEGMTYREWIYREIREAQPYQGTLIGAALEQAYTHTKDLSFGESQVMIISDGKSYSHENEDSVELARKMLEEANITVSTIGIEMGNNKVPDSSNMLPQIAEAGGGVYYHVASGTDISELVFATIADDLTESIIEERSPVKIVTYRDDTLNGILSFSDVMGFVNSKAKADSTTVLTVPYKKTATTTVDVPLYAYRDHGNGRISSFTSSLSGNWLREWSAEERSVFFLNVLDTNTPEERIDRPFDVNFIYGGDVSTVEILPSNVNPRARASFELYFLGKKVDEGNMIFDRNRYYAEIDTPSVGKYSVKITYSYGTHSFSADTYFNVSYQPEYDAFTAYDISSLYNLMRGVGSVYKDGNVDLEIDKNEVATYEYSFAVPLLIIAVTLLVADIFIRKTPLKDIIHFFNKLKKGAKAK